jgi:hypothetical protein
MLTIEAPFYQVRGVTIFRDHEDPDQHYCLPAAVSLARQGPDGGLTFTLYKYRRDLTDNPSLDPTSARGAGLALFEAEMPVEKAEILRSELAGQAQRPNARIDPVLFRSGKVHALAAHSSGDNLIEDLVETSSAPLSSPYHSAFALALSAEGAALFQQAALGGQLPVGVVYEMRFLALTPSLHARVRMDYERIYDHFSASIGFTYYVSAKLDLDLQWLIEHDFVRIEMTAFTDSADRDRQQELVMNLIKARIQNDFFRSGIPPEPTEGMSGPLGALLGNVLGSRVSSASALFVLKAKLEVVRERKDFELVFDGRTAVELTHVCSGFLSTMVKGAPPPVIREIDTDDPFFSALLVTIISTIDFEEMPDLREAILHVTYRDHKKSFVFLPNQNEAQTFQAALTKPGEDEYQYAVEYHFDPDIGGGATTIRAGPVSSRRRVLTLDPLAHFQYFRLQVALGPVDATLVPRIHVNLRMLGEPGQPDVARAAIDLDAQAPKQIWRQRLPLAAPAPRVRASSEWEDPRGERHALDDEREISGGTFVALGPYKDMLSVVVVPAADWSAIQQVRAELRYRDGEYIVERALLFDATNKASQTLQIPLLQRAVRKYQWRQMVLRLDGTATETEWAEVDQGVLAVGGEQKKLGEVRVVWIGDQGTALGLRIDFSVSTSSGDDEKVSIFLRARQEQEKAITLPLDPDGRLHYRYEVRRFTETGEELVKSGEGDSGLLVVR